jgi:ribosome biogenesis GTPase A
MIELEMQHVEVLKAEKEEREKLRLEKSALRRKKANANRK